MPLALAVIFALASCSFDPQGLGDAGSRGGAASQARTAVSHDGASPDVLSGQGDASQAGPNDGPNDARIAIDSSAPCLIGMAAISCAPEGLSCSQEDPAACALVRCACVAGFWACSSTPLPCRPH